MPGIKPQTPSNAQLAQVRNLPQLSPSSFFSHNAQRENEEGVSANNLDNEISYGGRPEDELLNYFRENPLGSDLDLSDLDLDLEEQILSYDSDNGYSLNLNNGELPSRFSSMYITAPPSSAPIPMPSFSNDSEETNDNNDSSPEIRHFR